VFKDNEIDALHGKDHFIAGKIVNAASNLIVQLDEKSDDYEDTISKVKDIISFLELDRICEVKENQLYHTSHGALYTHIIWRKKKIDSESVTIKWQIKPDSQNHSIYKKNYALYSTMYDVLKETFEHMNEIK